jgi:hypothetical protein
MNNGISWTKRNTMPAKVTIILISVDHDFVIFFGEAANTSDNAYAAIVAIILIDRYPAHNPPPILKITPNRDVRVD